MKHSRRWPILLVAVTLVGLLAALARAEVLVFTGESPVDPRDWNNAQNWKLLSGDPGHVPTPDDDVRIPRGQRSLVGPTLTRGAGSARSITVETGLIVTDGATLTVAGGTSSFAGNVTVRGGGTLVLDGDITWSAGTWNVGGAAGGMIGGTVENRGRLSITGDVSSVCPGPCGGVIRNVPGATIDSRGASPLLSPPFVNNGTLTVSAGTLAVHRMTPAAGMIQLLGGMLIIHGDYVQTGGFILLDNGTLRMAGTDRMLQIRGGTLGGSGTIEGNVDLTNASLVPGFRQLAQPGNPQLGILTIVGGRNDEFSLGQNAGSDFEIGGRAQGTEYDAVVSGAPMTFSVGGTLSVSLVNGFESTITRDDRFVIFETALNPIRGSFFNVANGGRLEATNTNGDILGTFSVHYGPNSTDSPTMVVLKDFDTAQRQQRVTLATTGQCANLQAIGEAIPGARAMADTAFNWFSSFNDRDRARVDLLLRANFRDDSEGTRFVVKDRILSIRESLRKAQNGNITFDCAPAADPECSMRVGYVNPRERDIIHLCEAFFGETLEARRWNLVHECAHLAGASSRRDERYWVLLGPVSESECLILTPESREEALDTADNYARLVWCLTKPPGTVIWPTR
jgi:hypothetical protein